MDWDEEILQPHENYLQQVTGYPVEMKQL